MEDPSRVSAKLSVRPLTLSEARARFDDLAHLRITVFREWPYLYDGDVDYERSYLATYFKSPNAFIAGAFHGDKMVGACTASPLADHATEFSEPFGALGLNLDDYFYFGESVLLPAYRGEGVGVKFFEYREAEAKRQGFSSCVFSAAHRPNDHPFRPSNYVPLDSFWRKRGYSQIDGLATRFAWKDIGESHETEKPMTFWMKKLT
ncbi:MAG: GNAT family N-acetyltransferase [Pseudomonadota bacterium]